MEIIVNFLEKYFSKSRIRILICLILMAIGFTNSEIKDKLGLSYTSLRKYRTAFESNKIEPLFTNGGERRKSELDSNSDAILNEFKENPPATLREANERIYKLTGKSLSLNRLRIFLKKRG